MTIGEALQQASERLKSAGVPEAGLDAEYLLADALDITRLRLPMELKSAMSPDAERRLRIHMEERLQRKPLAYILGEQPFFDLHLRVDPTVLIPRPETELLVEEAYRILDTQPNSTVVDVGTGSGCIALALARHPNVATIHAIDISPAALTMARENAQWNDIAKPIQWHQGDLLSPLIPQGIHSDLIAANLPYIRSKELAKLAPEIHWEPTLALDGGRDGLAYISQLIDQAAYLLKRSGTLLLEIGSDQGPAVLKLLKAAAWSQSEVVNDLAGLPRIVKARKGTLVGTLNH